MTYEDFIRELKEAMLKIELSNKRILLMHPEDIAILDLDKVSSSLYLVEERMIGIKTIHGYIRMRIADIRTIEQHWI